MVLLQFEYFYDLHFLTFSIFTDPDHHLLFLYRKEECEHFVKCFILLSTEDQKQ